jgi:hypothetical protein
MDGVKSLMDIGMETEYWDADSLRIDEGRQTWGEGWVVYAKVRGGGGKGGTRNKWNEG